MRLVMGCRWQVKRASGRGAVEGSVDWKLRRSQTEKAPDVLLSLMAVYVEAGVGAGGNYGG